MTHSSVEVMVQRLHPQDGDVFVVRGNMEDGIKDRLRELSKTLGKDIVFILLPADVSFDLLTDQELTTFGLKRAKKKV